MCNQRTYERKQDYELINRLFHSTHNFTLLKQSATSAASADLCLKSHISKAGNWNENRIDKQLHETNANWVREEAPRTNNILKAVKDKRTGDRWTIHHLVEWISYDMDGERGAGCCKVHWKVVPFIFLLRDQFYHIAWQSSILRVLQYSYYNYYKCNDYLLKLFITS